MPAAARGQVNCSARLRALLRRKVSGLLMIDDTAWAIARGSLSAVAPLSVVRISASADVRDTTAGVPQASASSAASPKVSCGPGASATSADARMVADRVAATDVPGEVDRQPGGLALQPRAHRSLPHHDEPRVHSRMSQRANGVDTPVRVFFHRKAPAVHQEQLFASRPLLSAPTPSGGAGETGRGRRPAARSAHSARESGRTPRGRTPSCTPRRHSWRRFGGSRHRRPRGRRDEEVSAPQADRGVRGRSSPWRCRVGDPTARETEASAGRTPRWRRVPALPTAPSPAWATRRGSHR